VLNSSKHDACITQNLLIVVKAGVYNLAKLALSPQLSHFEVSLERYSFLVSDKLA
jgi:hypothetical protein